MPRILVVDDDADTMRLVGYMVELAGYEVDLARNAREALALAQSHPPDAIVLDVMMYEQDGWSLFHELRGLTAAPVTFLTAWRTGENQQKARELGAAFLTKPLSPAVLAKQLASMLGQA